MTDETARPEPALSVIICTRDRAEALAGALSALCAADGAGRLDWELIVVDNGSRDETAAVTRAWADEAPFPLRRVAEPRPGLSIARNAGIARASGEALAFIDDDCRVRPQWLARVHGDARRGSSDPDAPSLVGGKVTLHDENDLSVSIRDYDDSCEIRDFGTLMARMIGCNFSVRRRVLARIGGFDERLGAGAPALAAEDLDFFYRALKAGFRIVYDPAMALTHAHGRRDPATVAALRRGYVTGRAAFSTKHALRGDLGPARRLYWEVASVLGPRRGPARPGALTRASHLSALGRGVVLRLLGR